MCLIIQEYPYFATLIIEMIENETGQLLKSVKR